MIIGAESECAIGGTVMTILERAQRVAISNESQLDALFDEHVEAIHAYALRRSCSAMAAEDIAAEVFSEVAARPNKIPLNEVRPWLFGIARRKLADYYRRRHTTELTLSDELLEGGNSPLGLAMDEEASRQLRRLVDSLLPDQREALLLHYVEELTAKQIAIVMRRSTFAVNSLLQRARRRLYEEGRNYFLDDGSTER